MSRLSQYADDLFDDFNDDQIRVIGQPEKPDKPRSPMRWDVLIWIMVLIGIGYLTWGLLKIQKVCVPHKGNGYSSHEVSRNFVDGFTYSAPR